MQNLSLFQSFRLRTFLSTKRSLQYFGTHMSGHFRKLNVFLVKEAMFYSADRWKIEIPINSNVLYSLFKDYINLYSFLSCACVYLCVFLPSTVKASSVCNKWIYLRVRINNPCVKDIILDISTKSFQLA